MHALRGRTAVRAGKARPALKAHLQVQAPLRLIKAHFSTAVDVAQALAARVTARGSLSSPMTMA
jgi:hypothetical protein